MRSGSRTGAVHARGVGLLVQIAREVALFSVAKQRYGQVGARVEMLCEHVPLCGVPAPPSRQRTG